jgi:hypothetical protein
MPFRGYFVGSISVEIRALFFLTNCGCARILDRTAMRSFLILFFVSFTTILTNSGRAQDWVQWDVASGGNGHWYKVVVNTNGLNWTQMDQIAADEGGYLATITSDAENQFVFSLINSPEFFSGNGGNGAGPAIGGYQPDGEPNSSVGWSWETGEPWDFSNWAPGQPDLSWETRLHFWSGTQGVPAPTWNNLPSDAGNVGGYVIERDNILVPARTGFYGQAFLSATGGTPLKPLLGAPAQATVSVYDSKGKLNGRITSSPVGQFFSREKPGDYTLIATQFKQPLPPNKLSLVSTNGSNWVMLQISVHTNLLTVVQISFTPAP